VKPPGIISGVNPRSRWPRLTLTATGLLLVAAVGAGAVYVYATGRQTAEVAGPSADATPEVVVATYVEALDAGDCAAAVALTLPEHAPAARSWCRHVQSLSNAEVHTHLIEDDPTTSGRKADEQVVYVPVSFDLNWRPLHSDGSMSEGPTSWGYLLVKGSEGAWRIYDEGVA
jgi:hypothetical protein